MLDECYTAEEVCKALKISNTTLWRNIRIGKMSCFKLAGGGLRFTKADIEKFIKSSRKVITPRNQNALGKKLYSLSQNVTREKRLLE